MNSLETQLADAVRSSKIEDVKSLLEKGCKVDVGDVDSVTPLHLAAMRDNHEVAELLLANGAKVNRKTADKIAPLHFAAARGLEDMVALLLRAGASVDALDANDRTPLYLAVTRGHIETAKRLVSHGAKVNIEEIHGYTPLCEAVWKKSVEMASLLITAGAKLTQSPHLLHYTVIHRHTEMAHLLLTHGAYPNLRDDHGDTPLMLAITCGHIPTIKLLLQHEANPNLSNSVSRDTPLRLALCVWNEKRCLLEDILRLLCEYNVDLDQAVHGLSPFYSTVCHQMWVSAEVVVQAGADVNRHREPEDHDSWTRCLNMVISNNPDMISLLLAAGFNLSKYKMTSLEYFSKKGSKLESIHGWLPYLKSNPRQLTAICRSKIRSLLGNKALFIIPNLEIPLSLKGYLLYNNVTTKIEF